jgi:hypothetical protein
MKARSGTRGKRGAGQDESEERDEMKARRQDESEQRAKSETRGRLRASGKANGKKSLFVVESR